MLFRKLMIAVAGVCLLLPACKSSIAGTYSDTMGSVILELRSGGKANFTFMGNVQDCSYENSGKQVTLSCKGEDSPITFTLHDDQSLTGPPGTLMLPLRKQK
jgi:hypothetical protein